METLKHKVSKDMKQQVAMLQRQQEEDRISLHQHVHVFPIELMITNFAERKSNNRVWYSPPFYSYARGYKMCLKVHANGEGDGKGTHVSVYTTVMRGAFDDNLKWPFQGRVVLQLCNQLEDKRHRAHTISFSETADPKAITRVTSGEVAESGCGTPTLIAHNDLNSKQESNCQYLKDDCLHFQVIAVESEPGVFPTELTMTNFEQHKIENDQWFSPPFYTHPRGYKMCLSVYANGDRDAEGTHVSVYARLMRGEFDDNLKWPFQDRVTVEMLNQLEDNHHSLYIIRFADHMMTTRTTSSTDNQGIGRVTDGERSADRRGYCKFLAHTDLTYDPAKNCQYLKYDCLRFRIVEVKQRSKCVVS